MHIMFMHSVSVSEAPSDSELNIVGLTMGSTVDEQAVMGRWQVQQSRQVTAAHCDTFMTLARVSHPRTHAHTRTHTQTHTSSSALWWHALVMMRRRSYLRHCSDKPCVCVSVAMLAFSSVGKRTNGWWGQRAVKHNAAARWTMKTDMAAVVHDVTVSWRIVK